MHARLVAGIVVLWACAAIAATSLDASRAAAGEPALVAGLLAPQGQGQKPVKPFEHSKHVNPGWVSLNNVEVFRDCRGCHRFTPENPHSSPQVECQHCHQGTGELRPPFEGEWKDDLSAYATRTSPAFRHYTHGMLACRECHYDKDVFADMPIQTGPASCAKCHGNTVTSDVVSKFSWLDGIEDEALAKVVGLQRAFTPPADAAAYEAYAKRLDSVFAGPKGGVNTFPLPPSGDFDHADHINTSVGAKQELVCTACHTDIRTAGATEVGTGIIPTDGCKTCHISDEDRTAVQPKPPINTTALQPLWSLGTFAHSDHFGFLPPGGERKDKIASDQAYTDIKGQQCAACHVYAPEVAGLSARDFPFGDKTSKHTYSDCVKCHTVEGWQTGEQKDSTEMPPLHSSNGGTGWRDCAACHELGKPDMAGLRPKESVQRWTERTFVFQGQTHPHITSKGIDYGKGRDVKSLQKECNECHRAVVPELPTRLIEKAFTHKTHLSAEPTKEDCAQCHESAGKAANSLALAGDDFLTYSLKSCATCHWGGDVTVQLEPKAKPKNIEVVAFPHGRHVQAGQSCTECHESAGDGRNMLTKPAALACNQCHKHEVVPGIVPLKRPPERLLTNEVASCIRCHHEDKDGAQVASVPPVKGTPAAASDDRYLATQTVFAGFVQSQFHPAGSECTECHTREDKDGKFAAIRVPTGNRHLYASVNLGVHADVGGLGKSTTEAKDCLRCHWTAVSGWDPTVSSSAGKEAMKELRKMPSSKGTRKFFGSLFSDYPGRKSKG
ncbi:MAG: hypothetical protein ACI89X_001139 [Planctomycetota bacterium]|jgi:hypothetical protein